MYFRLPSKSNDSNLSSIPYLIKKYGCRVGLSDHTLGNEIALASVALGSTMIEKHLQYPEIVMEL